MIHIIERDEAEKRWMKWAISCLHSDEKEALFINAECMDEKMAIVLRNTECSIVLYARERWGLLSDEKKKLIFPLLSRKNVGTISGYPFSFLELYSVYHAIRERKEVNNKFVVLAIRGSVIRELRALLSITPSEQEKKTVVDRVEESFGIRVKESEIRAELAELANIDPPSLAPAMPGRVVRGVFCDAEGSLFTYMNEVNKDTLKRLHDFEREKKLVVLWTSGSISNARKIIQVKNIRNIKGGEYSIIHKRHYAGRRVELVIDAFPDMESFKKRYRIFPEAYIRK